ncbi:DUF5668 domain-containing protein [Chryseolinea sp. T2]|uniref:LiaF transmembrane domain-containing protein n=1 Tax=Chryseolinea sp. T2 TaxID=3129255 RepID=UPI0030779A41
MENQQYPNTNYERRGGDQRFRSGRTFGGLVIVAVGTMLLAREVGVYFPGWVFSWPMWLIVLGFYIGVRHHFRNIGFLIPMAIGTAFLIDQMVPGIELREYLWPIMIIGVGLIMILRSRTRPENDSLFRILDRGKSSADRSDSGIFETVTIFGENKHQVLSKEFKGGESVCVFGGAEINLTQADITGRVPLELVQVFGGTKLIVPAHWKIESEEVVTIFGGLNDKRQFNNTVTDPTKTLVLRGTSIFGGIDIKSF